MVRCAALQAKWPRQTLGISHPFKESSISSSWPSCLFHPPRSIYCPSIFQFYTCFFSPGTHHPTIKWTNALLLIKLSNLWDWAPGVNLSSGSVPVTSFWTIAFSLSSSSSPQSSSQQLLSEKYWTSGHCFSLRMSKKGGPNLLLSTQIT